MADHPPNGRHDVLTHRLIAAGIALTGLFSAVGTIALTALGREVPSSLTALGSTALGALASLMISVFHPHRRSE